MNFFCCCCYFNPIALRRAKNQWSFGHSECDRAKGDRFWDFLFISFALNKRLL